MWGTGTGNSGRLTQVLLFLSLLAQPLGGLVVHPHEAVAVVNFDVEKAKRGEAENATHLSAHVIAEILQIQN